MLRDFISFLKKFYDATKIFSSSQQVSLHTAFHNLPSILCDLQKAAMNLNTIVASMGVYMKEKYDKYWGNVVKINQLLYFGVIFDLRYRFEYIEWSFGDLYGAGSDLAKEMVGNVQNNLFKLYNLYKSKVGSSGNNNSLVEQPALFKNPSLNAKVDEFKQHLEERKQLFNKMTLEGT